MKKACVIGWPISHSRSPIIHGYWLSKYKVEGRYERIPVEPQNLKEFIGSLENAGFEGCNVTMPHKEAVYQLVKPADESTHRLSAVNTVFRRNGELFGTNTDSEGFMNSLASGAKELSLQNSRAVVLGAGGAAASVVNALITGGTTEIALVNRSLGKAQALRDRFGNSIKPVAWERRSDVLTECDLLVNTTSLGMKGQPDLDIDLERLPLPAVVTDIVYVPLRTGLLERAAARGNHVVEGLGMLLHQAVRGFELWFGVRPTVTAELHDLVARDIDPDYQR